MSSAAVAPEIRSGPSLLSRYLSNPSGLIGGVIFLILVLAATVGPLLVDSPRQQDVKVRLQGPSLDHVFGTDEVGRDILARVVNGARISISSALVAVAVGLFGGASLGLIAGYLEGKIGTTIMAFMDLLLALPAILLAITIAA